MKRSEQQGGPSHILKKNAMYLHRIVFSSRCLGVTSMTLTFVVKVPKINRKTLYFLYT